MTTPIPRPATACPIARDGRHGARRAPAAALRATLVLLAVAFAPAHPAHAQSGVVAAPAASGWPARLAPGARASLDALADSVRADGLPLDPLHAKAAEGVLKGADDARIVGAVRRLAAELTAARAALGTDATSAELVAGASALRAGVSWAALRELASARGGRRGVPAAGAGGAAVGAGGGSLAMLLVVAGDLIVRGVPAEVATSSLAALAVRGVGESDLVALRRAVDRDIQGGVAPQAATAARTRAMALQLDERGRPLP